MAYTSKQTTLRTLGEVLSFMAPFAGGTVPTEGTDEYTQWVTWIQNKHEEYARRAFWRRCLTREAITISANSTTHVLPDRFSRPNALYVLEVDGIDWNDPQNTDEQTIFVEMVNDPDDADFGKWQMRFGTEVTTETSAILWFFSNPPVPNASSDILLLPGDMIGFAALAEYYRQANQEGSQDKAEQDAENRFLEYMSIETIPAPNELLSHRVETSTRTDHLVTARNRYANRLDRYTQN